MPANFVRIFAAEIRIMNATKEEVLKALSYVDDPDLKKDLVTLKMVSDIQIEGKKIFDVQVIELGKRWGCSW